MKAIQILEPGEVRLIDLPDPTPAAGEVLLQIHTVGYCGTDLSTFRGANPLVSYPRIPGHEVGATIVELGAGVEQWNVGQDVLVFPYTECGALRRLSSQTSQLLQEQSNAWRPARRGHDPVCGNSCYQADRRGRFGASRFGARRTLDRLALTPLRGARWIATNKWWSLAAVRLALVLSLVQPPEVVT